MDVTQYHEQTRLLDEFRHHLRKQVEIAGIDWDLIDPPVYLPDPDRPDPKWAVIVPRSTSFDKEDGRNYSRFQVPAVIHIPPHGRNFMTPKIAVKRWAVQPRFRVFLKRCREAAQAARERLEAEVLLKALVEGYEAQEWPYSDPDGVGFNGLFRIAGTSSRDGDANLDIDITLDLTRKDHLHLFDYLREAAWRWRDGRDLAADATSPLTEETNE